MGEYRPLTAATTITESNGEGGAKVVTVAAVVVGSGRLTYGWRGNGDGTPEFWECAIKAIVVAAIVCTPIILGSMLLANTPWADEENWHKSKLTLWKLRRQGENGDADDLCYIDSHCGCTQNPLVPNVHLLFPEDSCRDYIITRVLATSAWGTLVLGYTLLCGVMAKGASRAFLVVVGLINAVPVTLMFVTWHFMRGWMDQITLDDRHLSCEAGYACVCLPVAAIASVITLIRVFVALCSFG